MANTIPDNTLPEHPVLVGHVPTEPDQERLAYQILIRHEAPVTTIVTVIAVVAQDEILALQQYNNWQRHVRTVGRQDVMRPFIEILHDPQDFSLRIAARRKKVR